ncbi:MAG: hypothetical protein ACAH59_11840 [Pseudobdellovibrionaceae bacterium]
MKTLGRFLICLFVAVISCKPSTQNNLGGATSSGSTTPPDPGTPTATTAAPLSLRINRYYEGTETAQPVSFDVSGAITTTCEATVANPNVTCNVVLPEAELYFSKFKFLYSWVRSKCKIMTFTPYHYMAARAGSINPPWAGGEVVDCGARPLSADCFGGAAKQVIEEYPKYWANIYVPEEDGSDTPLYEDAEFTSAWKNTYDSNRMMSNDIDAADVSPGIDPLGSASTADNGDLYLGTVNQQGGEPPIYQDWTFTCKDDWYDDLTYQIHLNITDEDSDAGNPTVNHMHTWREY